MPSRKPFIRACAQVCSGSPPETAKVVSFVPVSCIHFNTVAAAVAPSLGGICVNCESWFPCDNTPTVKTGMPWAISLLVMVAVESDVVGWIDMQSIWPAASFTSICETCRLGSVWTGAMLAQSMG